MRKLNGMVALVTGSSSGIGKAVALLYAKHGASVVVTSSRNPAGGEATLKELQKLNKNGKHLHVNFDVTSRETVKKVFDTIAETYGKLDILVNNAGATFSSVLDTITEENYERELSLNLKSAIWCTQLAKPLMKKGWVINTTSICGLDYHGFSLAYGTTKAALNSFTRTVAHELAPNIMINAVLPGFTKTAILDGLPPEYMQKIIDSTAVKRLLTCEEVAEAFLFLVAQEYMTGTLLVVDGGKTIIH
jgi:3-oxoacyl-[acyl-carrier protein] reductase